MEVKLVATQEESWRRTESQDEGGEERRDWTSQVPNLS